MGRSGLTLIAALAMVMAGCTLQVAQGDAQSSTRVVDDEVTGNSAQALTPTATPTTAPEPTATPTSAPEPTPTLAPTPTLLPTATPTPVPIPTATPTPTLAPTPTPTAIPNGLPTPTPLPETNDLNTGLLSISELIFARTTPGQLSSELVVIAPDGQGEEVFHAFAGTVSRPKWSVNANYLVAFESDAEGVTKFVITDHTGTVVSRQQQWDCDYACNLHAVWPQHFEETVYIARNGALYEHEVATGLTPSRIVESFDRLPKSGDIAGIDLIESNANYVLSTDMDGNWDIYTGLGVDRVLATEDHDETDPKWSPDGKFIAYTTNKFGNHDIMLINLETGVFRLITTSLADDIEPTWSPDGKYIAFASNRNGNWDIYIASAEVGGEGKFLFQLTSGPEDDRAPNWRNYR